MTGLDTKRCQTSPDECGLLPHRPSRRIAPTVTVSWTVDADEAMSLAKRLAESQLPFFKCGDGTVNIDEGSALPIVAWATSSP